MTLPAPLQAEIDEFTGRMNGHDAFLTPATTTLDLGAKIIRQLMGHTEKVEKDNDLTSTTLRYMGKKYTALRQAGDAMREPLEGFIKEFDGTNFNPLKCAFGKAAIANYDKLKEEICTTPSI